jgi:hypothetical protein
MQDAIKDINISQKITNIDKAIKLISLLEAHVNKIAIKYLGKTEPAATHPPPSGATTIDLWDRAHTEIGKCLLRTAQLQPPPNSADEPNILQLALFRKLTKLNITVANTRADLIRWHENKEYHRSNVIVASILNPTLSEKQSLAKRKDLYEEIFKPFSTPAISAGKRGPSPPHRSK